MKIYDVPVNMILIKQIKAENEQQAQMLVKAEIEQGNFANSKAITADVHKPTDYQWAFE